MSLLGAESVSGVLLPERAREAAHGILGTTHPRRWAHTQGVVVTLAWLLDYVHLTAKEETLLLNAAWLHDIGYGLPSDDKPYGWHPLDGAAYLHNCGLIPVANLVAWHTTAREEAELLGLSNDLDGYPEPRGKVADLLTYADMTTGPDGYPCTYEQRLIEVRARHGAHSTPATAMENAWDRLDRIRTSINSYVDKAREV